MATVTDLQLPVDRKLKGTHHSASSGSVTNGFLSCPIPGTFPALLSPAVRLSNLIGGTKNTNPIG